MLQGNMFRSVDKNLPGLEKMRIKFHHTSQKMWDSWLWQNFIWEEMRCL